MPIRLKPWQIITEFALSLHHTEDFISKARKDCYELMTQYGEACRTVDSKRYPIEKLNNSLSWQNFHRWPFENIYSFYVLIFPGFRHTALRELRFHLESSARAYHLDAEFGDKTYEEKVTILTIFKPRRTRKEMKILKALLCKKQYDKVKGRTPGFGELLSDVPDKEQLTSFYYELCDYVHLSEIVQTDPLRGFGLDLALKHPQYETDREMLVRTFENSKYLLLRALEK